MNDIKRQVVKQIVKLVDKKDLQRGNLSDKDQARLSKLWETYDYNTTWIEIKPKQGDIS